MRRRALFLLVGVVLGVGTPVSLATFRDSASTAGNSVTADPDWVAPPIETAAVVKSQGGKAGYVRPGGQYYLCAKVGADSGNPASGLMSVTADLTRLTDSLAGAALGTAVGAPCTSAAHNRTTGPHTAKAAAASGTVALTTRDNDGNTRSAAPAVVVDGNPPAATTGISTTNGGATPGRAETNDLVTFTFDEPIDPKSVIDGWDGSPRSDIVVRVIQAAGNRDRLDVRRQTGPTTYVQVPVTATAGSPYLSLEANYASATVSFTASTIEVVGNDVVVRLGTPDLPGSLVTAGGATTMSWPTSSALYDWAGNPAPAQTITEGGAADREF